MLTVISPAKTLDYETPAPFGDFTLPAHLTQSRKLVKRLREFDADDLSKLMSVSNGIAELNQTRFKQWKTPFKPDRARQALFAFKGDVYLGLDAYSMTQPDIDFAQQHLRILSGLYGILRPLDLMMPYRLEMGTRLATDAGTNLYQFWDGRLTQALNKEMREEDSKVLLNLASNEYFKAIQPKNLKADIITPQFKDFHKGEYRFIQFHAKRARGSMARFVIDQRVDTIDGARDFDYDGYRFAPKLSDESNWVFTRRQ